MSPSALSSPWPSVALVVVLTAGVYFAAIFNGFVDYDDGPYVFENPQVRQGLTPSTIQWAFTTFETGLWAPLTRLSHALDVTLFGLNPAGHHATSVLLHTIAAALILLWLRRLFDPGWALLLASIFAVHPQRVEAVAWIASRKDVVCALFFVSTLLLYDGYTRAPSIVRCVGFTLTGALALLSKPIAVTLPCVLLLLDAWPYRRFFAEARIDVRAVGRCFVEKLPLIALVAGVSVITLQAQAPGIVSYDALTVNERLALAPVAYAIYLYTFFAPHPLAVPYPYDDALIDGWRVALSLTVLLAIAAWSMRRPQRAVGWLWFLGMLVPVIGIVQVGHHAYADRFTYLPHLGLLLILGAILPRFGSRAGRAVAAAGMIAVIVFLGLTRTQIAHWRSTETLFAHAVAVTDDNYVALNNLASAYVAQGRPADAIPLYEDALRIAPGSVEALNDLGVAHLLSGDAASAAECLARVVADAPDDVDARVNYGAALLELGRRDAARVEALAALKRAPNSQKARALLAMIERG